MREVEAETVFGNQRALLRDVIAQAIAQCCMDEVRRRVVGADTVTPLGIDFEMHGIADLDRTPGQLADMRMQAPQRLVGRLARKFEPLGGPDAAGIPGLAAALAIERGLVVRTTTSSPAWPITCAPSLTITTSASPVVR